MRRGGVWGVWGMCVVRGGGVCGETGECVYVCVCV